MLPYHQIEERLEQNSLRYHIIGCWVGASLDPLFAVTDFLNIPNHWKLLLVIRISVAALVIAALLLRKKLQLSPATLISIPLILISLQNAYTYSLIEESHLLGHNLNYMALFIGASLFVLWRWVYSLVLVILSTIATAYFVYDNPVLQHNAFFVQGGLLLIASAIFMIFLISTRYRLTTRAIKAQLELEESKRLLEVQAAEIRRINENLELLVHERTVALERKNKTLEEYAFINSHKLRAPVASILGLIKLFSTAQTQAEVAELTEHLNKVANSLDEVVRGITKKINTEE